MLDGVSNNNYLVTGPLNPVAPEAIQEYRISTNNYSAEYGSTAGFVANAVTRAGNNDFHVNAYWYLKNAALNAADVSAVEAASKRKRLLREIFLLPQFADPLSEVLLNLSVFLFSHRTHGITGDDNKSTDFTHRFRGRIDRFAPENVR